MKINDLIRSGVRTIVFDVHDTLILPARRVGQVYSEIAAGFGIKADPAATEQAFIKNFKTETPLFFKKNQGRTSPALEHDYWVNLCKMTFAEIGHPGFPDEAVREIFGYYASAEAWIVKQEVTESLNALTGKFTLFAASNMDGRLHNVLTGLGLAKHFKGIFSCQDLGYRKPALGFYTEIAEKSAEDQNKDKAQNPIPGQILFVGDDEQNDQINPSSLGFQTAHPNTFFPLSQ